jgi:hypothetical protein
MAIPFIRAMAAPFIRAMAAPFSPLIATVGGQGRVGGGNLLLGHYFWMLLLVVLGLPLPAAPFILERERKSSMNLTKDRISDTRQSNNTSTTYR